MQACRQCYVGKQRFASKPFALGTAAPTFHDTLAITCFPHLLTILQTALSAFMSSASALLPITRLVYNNSAARYAAAAAASNRRVDQAIAGLQGIAEQAGQGAANAASSIQRLSSIAAKSAKESLGEG